MDLSVWDEQFNECLGLMKLIFLFDFLQDQDNYYDNVLMNPKLHVIIYKYAFVLYTKLKHLKRC